MKRVIVLLLFITSINLSAQDMKTGFDYLEQGQYEEAEVFFSETIMAYPKNKTARLCYGRAIGLNNNPTAAKAIFATLLEEYPNDFELELNYAEALLWNKEYKAAEVYYKNLLETHPSDFALTLGYANTLSNLKEYDQALIYINKALALDVGNQNALVSRKYIRLGKASQLKTSNMFEEALAILAMNLIDFPNDIDTQLNQINIYLLNNDLDLAQETYETITNPIVSNCGLSLISHKRFQNKKALQYALKAKEQSLLQSDSLKIEEAHERFVQALLWNGKYAEAKEAIYNMEQSGFDQNKTMSLWSTYGMYTAKFSISLENYEAILLADSTSFNGNLGIANVYRAKGELKKAYAFANKTLKLYPNQKDALVLKATIETLLAPQIHSRLAYTEDNGDNKATTTAVALSLPWSDRFKTTVSYTQRTTENQRTDDMAYNTNMSLGAEFRLINNTWMTSEIGFIKADATTQEYTDVNGSFFVKSRPLPLQYLEVGYKRELQNFNAALIDEKIFMNNFVLNYNMGTNFGLGWYTGYTFTQQTDGNSRNLLFTSLYYNFSKRPNIKAGLNYQYLSYEEQIPELYFSPKLFQATEVFIDLEGTLGKWSYAANIATGFQFIEKDEVMSLVRMEGKVNYSISKELQLGVYGKYNNTASETASGFQFSEIGIKLHWNLMKLPLFNLD